MLGLGRVWVVWQENSNRASVAASFVSTRVLVEILELCGDHTGVRMLAGIIVADIAGGTDEVGVSNPPNMEGNTFKVVGCKGACWLEPDWFCHILVIKLLSIELKEGEEGAELGGMKGVRGNIGLQMLGDEGVAGVELEKKVEVLDELF